MYWLIKDDEIEWHLSRVPLPWPHLAKSELSFPFTWLQPCSHVVSTYYVPGFEVFPMQLLIFPCSFRVQETELPRGLPYFTQVIPVLLVAWKHEEMSRRSYKNIWMFILNLLGARHWAGSFLHVILFHPHSISIKSFLWSPFYIRGNGG